MTLLLLAEDIQLFMAGVTDHRVTKPGADNAFVVAKSGSPSFTLALESVTVDLSELLLLFFVQATAKAANRQEERKTLAKVFMIKVF
jgi:hypothetical protein